MLGYFEAFTPRFVKKYANLAEIIEKAMREFGEDVKSNKFPEEKHCYRMLDGEYEKLQTLLRKTLSD
jgi:3-methyl-2-oxobutanoate hydroxymethyltransferase